MRMRFHQVVTAVGLLYAAPGPITQTTEAVKVGPSGIESKETIDALSQLDESELAEAFAETMTSAEGKGKKSKKSKKSIKKPSKKSKKPKKSSGVSRKIAAAKRASAKLRRAKAKASKKSKKSSKSSKSKKSKKSKSGRKTKLRSKISKLKRKTSRKSKSSRRCPSQCGAMQQGPCGAMQNGSCGAMQPGKCRAMKHGKCGAMQRHGSKSSPMMIEQLAHKKGLNGISKNMFTGIGAEMQNAMNIGQNPLCAIEKRVANGKMMAFNVGKAFGLIPANSNPTSYMDDNNRFWKERYFAQTGNDSSDEGHFKLFPGLQC